MSPSEALAADLAARLGADRVSVRSADQSAYAQDLWPRTLLSHRAHDPAPHGPAAIVWPASRDELAGLIEMASAKGFQLQPYGAGSGVVGAVRPDAHTVMVDTKRMRTLHRVDLDAGVCEADAGILGEHLEQRLGEQGATLGHFPSSIYCSTLGGWVATRSAGQCSGRYGKIEDMVVSVDGVMATGEPVTAGIPEAGALDMRPLWVGHEGTFGFITRATLRIWPAPTARRGLAVTFERMQDAWESLREMYQSGLRPAVSRLYDPFDTAVFMQGATASGAQKAPTAPQSLGRRNDLLESFIRHTLNRPGPINRISDALGSLLRGRSLLIVIFEETAADPAEDALSRARALCRARGAFDAGQAPVDRWIARRHAVSYRMPPTFARGMWADTMEVAAPWSRLDALHRQVREALGAGGFVMAHMSHAYPDGCSIYFTFAGASPDDHEALRVYDATWRSALAAAHDAGGTVAHHHGIGRSKREAMLLEWGGAVRVLEALRVAADPKGVMVRGPLVPMPDERPPGDSALGAPASRIAVDRSSRLVTAEADITGRELREVLASAGLSLEGIPDAQTVSGWLAAGAPGHTVRDPVDHLVAGWRMRLADGTRGWWQPSPRRAAGPEVCDLIARDGRFGALTSVTFRVRGHDEAPCWTPTVKHPSSRDGALTRWVERAGRAMRGQG